jgi:tetratricopeptide (TPR) repeat protein
MCDIRRARNTVCAIVFASALPWLSTAALSQTQTPSFVAPPRTIADITAILDQEKPDPKVAARMREEADASPAAGVGQGELAKFHYRRCIARSAIGDFRAAVADCEKAVEYAERASDVLEYGRIRQGLAIQYTTMGDPKKALQVLLKSAQLFNVKGAKGFLFNIQRNTADRYIQLGDFNQAEAYVRKSQAGGL